MGCSYSNLRDEPRASAPRRSGRVKEAAVEGSNPRKPVRPALVVIQVSPQDKDKQRATESSFVVHDDYHDDEMDSPYSRRYDQNAWGPPTGAVAGPCMAQ